MCEAQQTARRCMLGAVLGFEPVKHAVLLPYSLWKLWFTQMLFLDRTHRELYCELYCITALFLHVWPYHALQ